MIPAVLVASVLVLHPVLDEPATLRLVASGTDDAQIAWSLDGEPVATTRGREATRVQVGPGEYTLRAETPHDGTWRALARPEPTGDGWTYVPAWTAVHDPDADHAPPDAPWLDPVPLGLAAVGALLVLLPRRRPKRP